MTRFCAHPGCGKLLVLVMGTRMPRFCWDHSPDRSAATPGAVEYVMFAELPTEKERKRP